MTKMDTLNCFKTNYTIWKSPNKSNNCKPNRSKNLNLITESLGILMFKIWECHSPLQVRISEEWMYRELLLHNRVALTIMLILWVLLNITHCYYKTLFHQEICLVTNLLKFREVNFLLEILIFKTNLSSPHFLILGVLSLKKTGAISLNIIIILIIKIDYNNYNILKWIEKKIFRFMF